MKSCKPADDQISLAKVQTDCGMTQPLSVTPLDTTKAVARALNAEHILLLATHRIQGNDR